eukprot:CAMPEP_0167785382 /NCGR_PEP_ID=MMETSP0111_2-20121227/8204_1 /TAXON_ID=91324 /ORGANISM="Lotharella globosa, Strain CCCM811" /LENGTH=110 /DNA_ID=CAMNT_0007676643 /DNA_START=218 /DNA_END=547 /DNA_ORIENTATION=+
MLFEEGHDLLLVLVSYQMFLNLSAVTGIEKCSGHVTRFPLDFEVFELVAALLLQEGPQLPELVELSSAAGFDGDGSYLNFRQRGRRHEGEHGDEQKSHISHPFGALRRPA